MLFAMVPNIFISYSHRDEVWRNELVRHLRVLERAGILKIWDTSEIQAGSQWSSEIRDRIDHADLAVILVSPDALASDFFVETELPALIRRQHAGQIVVVPVLLRRSAWTAIEGSAELQFANSPSKPLSDLPPSERDATFAQIAERISSLARAVSQRKIENVASDTFRAPLPQEPDTVSVYFISQRAKMATLPNW